MRDIPKAQVAAIVHSRGLLMPLIQCAASGAELAPAAQALIDAIMDPVKVAIDLDDAQYQAGVAGLVDYGVISQADADAVAALYVAPEQFTATGVGLFNGVYLATFAGDRGTLRAAPVGGPDADVFHILAAMNSGG